eukprot:5874609-Pyramimonas_sp.AAC.1
MPSSSTASIMHRACAPRVDGQMNIRQAPAPVGLVGRTLRTRGIADAAAATHPPWNAERAWTAR